MQCPFCQEEVGSEDDLQLHCLVCPSAYAEPGSVARPPRVDSVVVRFRWVKSRPCFEREVHLISSLAGSVTLHWKEDEGLYESDTVGVPVGPHICQLAIGGDVVPTEEFEINEESDVIFIILQEANYGYMAFDESNRRARIRTDDLASDGEPELVDTHNRPAHPLDVESRENQTEAASELSPLYRELLQHQLSHGEPSWVPGSGVQSPVMSEVDLSALAGQQDDDDDEPPILTPQPDSIEELQPSSPVPLHTGMEAETRPGDLSGESDGVPSLPDGGEVEDQSENEAEEELSTSRPPAPPSSASPVPSSHSEHNSQVSSRDSPVNSVPSEEGARDDSVISPLLDEALRHDSPPPITESPLTEGEHTNVVPPYTSTPATPGRDHAASTEDTGHAPSADQASAEEHPREQTHSSSRASPLGSVLEAVAVPVTDINVVTSAPDALPSDHEATSPPQRHSPAGSVHSSSLFSSGLPTPIMSPRGRSQSDTGVPLASRGSPLGSVHVQTQLPVRPQSLGGSVNLSEMAPTTDLLTTLINTASHLESGRGPISGAEEFPASPVLRQSPTGSNNSTSIHPQGGSGLLGDTSRHSSQRSTPVLSAHGGPPPAASPFVASPGTLPSNHEESRNSTPSVHSPRHRTSGAGSPTELLMETVYRQATANGSAAAATPPVMPSSRASHRDSENSTPSVRSPRHRTSRAGSQSELLAETGFRQGTPPVSSRERSSAATPPVMPHTSSRMRHRDSENSALSVHSPRHRTSGAGNPSDLLAEAVYRRGTPQLSSHSGSSRASRGQSPASSVRSGAQHSSPPVLSPPLPNESVIPSRGSAFATVNGERGPSAVELSSELEVVRQERDTLANELRQRAAHYEAELRRVKSRNEDLEQQMLSVETVANLTKQDDEKTQELEQKVLDLNRALREKDEEASSLQETVRKLERTNQQLKDEQESLKTVNQLRLDDLQQELSDLQRKAVESSRANGKIIELKVLKNTLEQHVKRLEQENQRLQRKVKQAEQEIDTMKAITRRSGSRLGKAKSETDLSKKFDRYTSYDKHKYGDYEPSKSVSFATRGDSLGLGTTRFSSLDTNYTRSHEVGMSSPVIVNGYVSPRSEAKRLSSYTSFQDRLSRDPLRVRTTVPRHRVGSLGEDSDVSDDLDHGVGYHTGTQPRWRTQSSDSSTSSVVSWDHDYSAAAAARQPRASAYNTSSSLYREDDRVSGRRRRPHSYHGATGSLDDVFGSRDDYTSYQVKSSPHSHSLRDVGHQSTSSSSYSTDTQPLGTVTPYHSAGTTSRASTKLFSKPFAPTSSSDIQLGMEVLVTRSRGQIGRGIVKYVGPIPGRKETYIGVELRQGEEGKHDGSLNGQRLFSCKPNRGIFVSFNKVVMCYG